jgi:DNA-binding GntR family transcriptional regulator
MMTAVQLGSAAGLKEIITRLEDFDFCIKVRAHEHLAASHESLLTSAAAAARQPILTALCAGLADAIRPHPIWWKVVQDRKAWEAPLEEVIQLVRAKDALGVRNKLREHLQALDERLCRLLSGKPATPEEEARAYGDYGDPEESAA